MLMRIMFIMMMMKFHSSRRSNGYRIFGLNNDGDACLIDSATSHTILDNRKHFSHLKEGEKNINTLSVSANLIEDFRRVIIFFS